MAASRRPLTVLVLAAGQSKRMKSKRIKLLHSVAGRAMVSYVMDAARALRPSRVITVIGYQGDEVRDAIGDGSDRFVVQAQRRGTGHAVLRAEKELRSARNRTVLIVNGDLPTLRPTTLQRLLTRHRRTGSAMTLVTCEIPDASGYGRTHDGSGGRLVEVCWASWAGVSAAGWIACRCSLAPSFRSPDATSQPRGVRRGRSPWLPQPGSGQRGRAPHRCRQAGWRGR